jgi:hypothetical protein
VNKLKEMLDYAPAWVLAILQSIPQYVELSSKAFPNDPAPLSASGR